MSAINTIMRLPRNKKLDLRCKGNNTLILPSGVSPMRVGLEVIQNSSDKSTVWKGSKCPIHLQWKEGGFFVDKSGLRFKISSNFNPQINQPQPAQTQSVEKPAMPEPTTQSQLAETQSRKETVAPELTSQPSESNEPAEKGVGSESTEEAVASGIASEPSQSGESESTKEATKPNVSTEPKPNETQRVEEPVKSQPIIQSQSTQQKVEGAKSSSVKTQKVEQSCFLSFLSAMWNGLVSAMKAFVSFICCKSSD